MLCARYLRREPSPGPRPGAFCRNDPSRVPEQSVSVLPQQTPARVSCGLMKAINLSRCRLSRSSVSYRQAPISIKSLSHSTAPIWFMGGDLVDLQYLLKTAEEASRRTSRRFMSITRFLNRLRSRSSTFGKMHSVKRKITQTVIMAGQAKTPLSSVTDSSWRRFGDNTACSDYLAHGTTIASTTLRNSPTFFSWRRAQKRSSTLSSSHLRSWTR
jgi:hypothetical protein